MTDQTASAAAIAQSATPLETPITKQDAPPASEPPVEEWDKERAMNTIRTLREIEKKAKADAKELERLKADEQKRNEEQMTQTERLQKQNAELMARYAELETNTLRRDVAAELGIPAVFAERIRGGTRDEMLEDAKKILEALPKQNQTAVQAVTNPGQATVNETEAQMRERIFGKQGNVFDKAFIEANGGGVVWKNKP